MKSFLIAITVLFSMSVFGKGYEKAPMSADEANAKLDSGECVDTETAGYVVTDAEDDNGDVYTIWCKAPEKKGNSQWNGGSNVLEHNGI